LIDLVLVVTVDPSVAIERELKPRLSKVPGSIMNEPTLASINDALSQAVAKYKTSFKRIKVYDTTSSTARRTNIDIANGLLDEIERFLDPDILVVSIDAVKSRFSESSSCFSDKIFSEMLDFIKSEAKFVKRSLAEQADDLVQIIAGALLTHSEKIFLFKLGHAWDEANPDSRRHLGLLYELEIDSEDVANDLQAKAFKSGRGYGLLGQFLTPEELRGRAGELQLESWSAEALEARVGEA
jgi:hypothetical protein